MDTVDWINQVTCWLLLVDVGLLLRWAAKEAMKK